MERVAHLTPTVSTSLTMSSNLERRSRIRRAPRPPERMAKSGRRQRYINRVDFDIRVAVCALPSQHLFPLGERPPLTAHTGQLQQPPCKAAAGVRRGCRLSAVRHYSRDREMRPSGALSCGDSAPCPSIQPLLIYERSPCICDLGTLTHRKKR